MELCTQRARQFQRKLRPPRAKRYCTVRSRIPTAGPKQVPAPAALVVSGYHSMIWCETHSMIEAVFLFLFVFCLVFVDLFSLRYGKQSSRTSNISTYGTLS